MPGNIAAATATVTGVLPQATCRAFSETRQFPMLHNQLHDGTPITGLITDGVNAAQSLKTWKQTRRLPAAVMATLIAFIESHIGVPFYFYNPFEPAGHPIGSNYDSTGTSTQGRHICRFTMPGWSISTDLARSNIEIAFKEIT